MQGMERPDRQLLDAQALVGHLVAPASMFAFLAAHRQDLFGDNEFEDLFPSGKGRPPMPASVMASILVLQTLHDLSDRETAEAVKCDLRWKVATGMALDDKGFDPSTLVYWRKRLARSQRPQRINEAVRRVTDDTGVVRGRGNRAVDSTILADAVATQDTITQLISAIRRVGRIVPGAAEAIAAVCTGHDYRRPGKPLIDWDGPGAKDALVRRWSTTRTHCWRHSPGSTGTWRPRSRWLRHWRCWRWSPAKMWNRRKVLIVPTGGAASPVRSPRTG